jgi:hypothetical protein
VSVGTDGPETIGEAVADDRRTAAYRRAGLCVRCSSHLSKGHAYGFARIPGDPCDDCAPIVATFPEPTVHPLWRKHRRGRVGRPSTRPSAFRGVAECAELRAAAEERTGHEGVQQ